MKHSIYFVLLAPLFLSLGCNVKNECSGTITATYQIGTDVSADFSVNEVPFTAEILTSTCSSLSVGQTTDDTVDNISRATDTLTFTQDSEPIEAAIAGTDVGEFSKTEDVAGCSITVTLTGTLETSDNTLVTSGDFTAEGVSCNASL